MALGEEAESDGDEPAILFSLESPGGEFGCLSSFATGEFFDHRGWRFSSVEQLVAHRRATMFGDDSSAAAILACSDPRSLS